MSANVKLLQASNLENILEARAICYKSDPLADPQVLRKRITSLISQGHESVLEHVNYTWKISKVSRALTHQLVRHRIASYSQQSQRYCKVNTTEPWFFFPASIKSNPEAMQAYYTTMMYIENCYHELLRLGIKGEDARYILPNASYTEIIMTMNVRAFRNFLALRTDKHAQQEIRDLAYALYYILPTDHQFMFADIVPYREPMRCAYAD